MGVQGGGPQGSTIGTMGWSPQGSRHTGHEGSTTVIPGDGPQHSK